MHLLFSQYWKIIVGLVAIFIGGLGFGAVLESLRHRAAAEQPLVTSPDHPGWTDNTLASLSRQLDLTEQQRAHILPDIESAAGEIDLARQAALLKFQLSLLALHRAIRPKLEPAQQEKLDQSQILLENLIQQRSAELLNTVPEPIPHP